MVRARPLALEHVRVTGGPLKRAQDVTREIPALARARSHDGVLPHARRTAAEGASRTADGTAAGRNLTGHIAGHHLSAVSLMYRATGDARFKTARRLSRERAEGGAGQARRRLSSALEGGREAFAAVSKGEIRSGGLRSQRPVVAVVHAAQDVRRTARRAIATPATRRRSTSRRSSPGGPSACSRRSTTSRSRRMLNTEHGGMNEVLADLYADTGDTTLARRCRTRSSTTSSPTRSSAIRTTSPASTATVRSRSSSARRRATAYTGDPGDISRRDVLLGSRRAAPQLRDRRTRARRVLRAAGSA